MAELLEVENLEAGYDDAIVLRGISFQVDAGETLSLLGRNGTGKTTLINALIGVVSACKGGVTLLGAPLSGLAPHRRAWAGIGWVPQERNIFKSLTVHENLSAVARPGYWSAARVYDMFPRLAERQGNMGTQLSGGEQQMLAIGRALVLNPRLLLLDEPTEGLAPILVDEVLDGVRRATRTDGMSAIIVEQHPRLILPISDHAIVLDQGTITHRSQASVLMNDPELMNRLLGVAR